MEKFPIGQYDAHVSVSGTGPFKARASVHSVRPAMAWKVLLAVEVEGETRDEAVEAAVKKASFESCAIPFDRRYVD